MTPKPPPKIFERRRRKYHRQRFAGQALEYAFLSDIAAVEIADRFIDVRPKFQTAAIFGAGRMRTSHLDNIVRHAKFETVYHVDFFGGNIIGSEEVNPLAPESMDCVLSYLNLHKMNDLLGALIQIRRALRPGGMFLAVMPGGETLYELRHCLMSAEQIVRGGVAPRVHPFADKQQMSELLSRAGFSLPVVDSDKIMVSYPDIYRLMHDLRGMGEANTMIARPKFFTRRSLFDQAEQLYREAFAGPDPKDGTQTISTTFELIYLIGWREEN